MYIKAKTECDNCKKDLKTQHWTTLILWTEHVVRQNFDFCNKSCLKKWVTGEKAADTAAS